jgi:hypothetical protein
MDDDNRGVENVVDRNEDDADDNDHDNGHDSDDLRDDHYLCAYDDIW